MKIFDMHVHAINTTPQPERLIGELSKAGIYGCSVISNKPIEMNREQGTDFETRLNEIMSWTNGFEDRLIPFLWVHPDEEGIEEKIDIAVKRGVTGFKVICNNFYVGETKSMDMLSRIASHNKPIIFHSGILWDGAPSSNYNRPANWEAMLELPGVKFSLAHCSWPWIDECIALYGKFLNALLTGKTTEMFVDLTPGTPVIYREELFKKLLTVGYDVPNNIMYGTDCRTDVYRGEWTQKWLKIDTALFDKFGVGEKMRRKIFAENFMRFIGRSKDEVTRFVPRPDSQTEWSVDLEK